jgi:hypothetical protein
MRTVSRGTLFLVVADGDFMVFKGFLGGKGLGQGMASHPREVGFLSMMARAAE